MATIKDIARIAGVGLGTVSRALNGEPNIRPDTRDRILETARRLHYRPNESARRLARREFSSATVGIVIPVVSHPFYFEILRGIYFALNESDKNLLVFNLGRYEELVVEHISKENLAGIIVVSAGISPESKNLLSALGTPVAYIDRYEKDAACFRIDNTLGGNLAAKYLAGAGCRSIVYLGEESPSQQQDERLGGFRDTLKAAGIPLREKFIYVDDKTAYEAVGEMLKEEPFDGIFCFCDRLAYGARSAIQESGLPVRVIGYDDAPASQYLGLSSVRQPAFEIGYEGGIYISAAAAPGDKSDRVFQPEVVDRGS
ncbi:MAG: hypothetical protein A2Y33_05775 [Spirochaetes bacterium GWF1_51_8]|nr:MAG: hypothetical protein A2Y33_05775 [Spirochaetes bacterium GWF1_51_8]